LLYLRFHREDAEDAVQEALMRAFQSVRSGHFCRVRDEERWLRKVAVRSALTISGRRFRRVRVHAFRHDPEVRPFDAFDREEEVRARLLKVYEAAGRLPNRLREVFVYCKVDGHTIAEAAEHFGLPPGTVNGRLIRARGLLRARLGVETRSEIA
jgi:RNA polymerase sigma factor (sigma-70 family)